MVFDEISADVFGRAMSLISDNDLTPLRNIVRDLRDAIGHKCRLTPVELMCANCRPKACLIAMLIVIRPELSADCPMAVAIPAPDPEPAKDMN